LPTPLLSVAALVRSRPWCLLLPRRSLLIVIGWVTSVALASSLGLTDTMLARIVDTYGNSAKSRVLKWQRLVDENMHATDTIKLEVVNKFFNDYRFLSDAKHWHKEDYWATPIEFIGTKGGDCEDFAIAKYITLRALNIPDQRLRITYVTALHLNQAHMVLTYYPMPKTVPLVLDNIDQRILPANQRDDLKPLYSFNADGLWLAKMRGEGRRVGSADDLDMWKDFVVRLEDERGTL